MTDRFRMLHVCTGNICRSPLAERLTVAGLGDRLGRCPDAFEVRSAGTWGHAGQPMEPFAEKALAELGADATGFEARELNRPMVEAADLVLTAAREHRAAVVTLVPTASSRAFTLREFARLCTAVDPATLPAGDVVGRARALVRLAAAARGTLPPVPAAEDDLEDPYGAPARRFSECALLIAEALRGPLDLLGAPDLGRGPRAP